MTIGQHVQRIRAVWYSLAAGLAVLAVVVLLLPVTGPTLPQARHFLTLFVAIAVLNLVSVMPVYRAMLAGPRRVYAVSGELAPLLAAHFHAHVVALARVEIVAVLGLVLYLLAGRGEWFWLFAAFAAAGLLVLWPLTEKVRALTTAASCLQPGPDSTVDAPR